MIRITIILYSVILFSAIASKLYAQNTILAQRDTIPGDPSNVQLTNDSLSAAPKLNIILSTGLIGNNSFGIHPIINIFAGVCFSSSYYFLEYEHRYGHSNNDYLIADDNTLKTVNAYNSNYYGLGYQQCLVNNPENDLYAIAGLGNEWIEIKRNDVIKYAKTLRGVAFNVGLGYTYYFGAKHGPNVQIIYYNSNIDNNGGTTFDQSSVVVRISYLFGRNFQGTIN